MSIDRYLMLSMIRGGVPILGLLLGLWTMRRMRQQEAIARHFAKTDHKSFERIDYRISDDNVPILPGGLARLDCRTERVVDAGDHHIIIGEVIHHEAQDGAPLMYYNGSYARF